MSIEPGSGKVVIGLGTGRSGTASLTSLIDRQSGGICFHEMNPSGAVFEGNPQPHVNAVVEFSRILNSGDRRRLSVDYSRPSSVETYQKLQDMEQVRLIGDIAYYYLNYVEDLIEAVPACVFVCLRRDKQKTVASWLKKSSIHRWRSLWIADRLKSWLTRSPFYTEYNYWQEHDGSKWKPDPVWDSCFPNLEAATKEEAISLYWDYYYLEADRLQKKYPQCFRIFDVEGLSDPQGQKEILSFIGLSQEQMVLSEDLHLHRLS